MFIEGEIKINGWARPVDMNIGDTFVVEDEEDSLYLAVDYGFVNLATDELITEDSQDWYEFIEKVVRKIKCKIVILED